MRKGVYVRKNEDKERRRTHHADITQLNLAPDGVTPPGRKEGRKEVNEAYT